MNCLMGKERRTILEAQEMPFWVIGKLAPYLMRVQVCRWKSELFDPTSSFNVQTLQVVSYRLAEAEQRLLLQMASWLSCQERSMLQIHCPRASLRWLTR